MRNLTLIILLVTWVIGMYMFIGVPYIVVNSPEYKSAMEELDKTNGDIRKALGNLSNPDSPGEAGKYFKETLKIVNEELEAKRSLTFKITDWLISNYEDNIEVVFTSDYMKIVFIGFIL